MLNPVWLHTFKTLIEVGHFTQTAHFLILYRISDSGSVVIEEIMLDSNLHGSKLESKNKELCCTM